MDLLTTPVPALGTASRPASLAPAGLATTTVGLPLMINLMSGSMKRPMSANKPRTAIPTPKHGTDLANLTTSLSTRTSSSALHLK